MFYLLVCVYIFYSLVSYQKHTYYTYIIIIIITHVNSDAACLTASSNDII